MHLSKKQRAYTLFVVFILAFGGLLAFWLHTTRTQVDLASFVAATLSVLISLVALFIALQTYLSIDSVNNITRMDGNILDNENYVTSIPEFIDEYVQETPEALCHALFGKIRHNLRHHSSTALDFSDTLQGMIDVLVLFPVLDLKNQLKNDRIARDVAWIIRRLRRRADELHSISKGNSIQIREAVKLFMAVYEYQRAVENKGALGSTGLLQVRAAMIRNPVSATVYHNYLGLYYRKCAVQVFDNQDQGTVSTIRGWNESAKMLKDGDKEKLRRYLNHASAAFAKALELSADDPMWRGYVLFNQARVSLIESVFFGGRAADPLEQMQAAIDARTTLNELISEVTGGKPPTTVLERYFLYEEEYARQLYVNYCLALGEPAMYRGSPVEPGESFQELVEPYVQPLNEKNRAGLRQLHA